MENDWLAGYVGAILEKGVVVLNADNKDKVDVPDIEGESGTAIRYFVNEATGFSEVQLHRTWLKVCDTSNIHESCKVRLLWIQCYRRVGNIVSSCRL